MRAYNQAQFIDESIQSVLNQTYRHYELIVVNDGSTDDTQAKLEKYKNQVCIINQTNSGRSNAGNVGIENSKGTYIAFLDSDDLWDKDFLKNTVEFLESETKFDIVYTGWDFINEYGVKIGKSNWPVQKKDYLYEFVLGAIFPIHAALIKKKCFIKCGGFDNSITIGEDWHLWFRFALAGFKFTCIQEDLVKYRRHSENTTPCTLR